MDLDYDTLIITELTDFKNTHFYVLPLLSQRPKWKRYRYPSLQPQLMCGKWGNEFHLKWVPWPFVGFHMDSPHFITYKITNLSHPAFSVVFLSFFFLCLFDNSFFIWLLISRDMQICPTGCNVIICGSGGDICWLCSFKTVHFLDWYLYPLHLCVQCI